MSNKKIKELKTLSKDELNAKVHQLEANLFDLKIKRETSQLEEQSVIWKARKELARVKMLLGKMATQSK